LLTATSIFGLGRRC